MYTMFSTTVIEIIFFAYPFLIVSCFNYAAYQDNFLLNMNDPSWKQPSFIIYNTSFSPHLYFFFLWSTSSNIRSQSLFCSFLLMETSLFSNWIVHQLLFLFLDFQLSFLNLFSFSPLDQHLILLHNSRFLLYILLPLFLHQVRFLAFEDGVL